MADEVRYAKTPKGAEEIIQRRNNLRGKMRMMLILVDPTKSADQLRSQAAQIGVPPDFLETMVRDGYIAPVAGAPTAAAPIPGVTATAAVADEPARLAKAKTFMKETLAAGVGQRATDLGARVERCSTRAELAQLLPDYERAIAGLSGDLQADMLADRLRKLLA